MKNKCLCLLWLAVFLFASTSAVHACLNPIGSSRVSEPIVTSGLGPEEFLTALLTHPNKEYWKNILTQLEDEPLQEFNAVDNKTNRAVAMLHLGQVKEAIRILEALEKNNSGHYYTAANLGTAYELNGENAKALRWIKEGITRNKEAHNGSEWLHVRILEAKLALEKDPTWLNSRSVIGIDRVANAQLQPAGLIVPDHAGQPRDIKQIEDALIYQLHERLEFIKPPEGVVANLLFDLARVLSISRSQDHGEVVTAFASTYGSDLMPWSLLHVPVRHVVPEPPRRSYPPYWIGGLAALLVLFLVAFLALQRRLQKSN